MSKDKKPKTPDLITGEEEAKLKELIKKLIKQELQDLDETSTTSGTGGTGGIDGFSTPFAFSKKGGTNNATKATLKQNPGSKLAEEELDEKKDHKKKKKPDADGDGVPDWADKHPGEPDQNFEKKAKKKAVWKKGVEKLQKDLDSLDENEKKLNEAVSRYARLKENPKRHSYKVSLITQEITKMLREVDFLMSVNQRLKTEMNVPNEELWKRTSGRIAEIKARLKSIGMKLRKLQ
jgi:hypothetical protein